MESKCSLAEFTDALNDAALASMCVPLFTLFIFLPRTTLYKLNRFYSSPRIDFVSYCYTRLHTCLVSRYKPRYLDEDEGYQYTNIVDSVSKPHPSSSSRHVSPYKSATRGHTSDVTQQGSRSNLTQKRKRSEKGGMKGN